MKNLILSMAVGNCSTIESVEVFLKSLRKYYDGDVCFVVDNKDVEFVGFLKKHNVFVYYTSEKVDRKNIMQKRCEFVISLLNNEFNYYDNVIISDVRDVVVQSNPFDHLSGSKLDLAAENKTIVECPSWNSKWIREMYGEEVFQRIKNKTIVNGGVFGGKTQAILDLFEMLYKEYQRFGDLFTDQGSLNYFYSTGILDDVTAHKTGSNLFATIGFSLGPCSVNDEGILVCEDGVVPAMIHQYDRHSDTMKKLIDKVNTYEFN